MNRDLLLSRRGDNLAELIDVETNEVDQVLLQIALAFTIILGYLLYDGVLMQMITADQLAGAQIRVAGLEKTIDRIKGKPVGEVTVENADLERMVQQMELLSAWKDHRLTRDLFRNLLVLRDTGLVRLDPSRRHVPDDPRYASLVKEARRAFPAVENGERVSRVEVNQIVVQVWNKVAHHRKDGQRDAAEAATNAAFDADLFRRAFPEGFIERIAFEPDVPSSENLAALARQIGQDLEEERLWLGDAQDRLVKRICEKRIASLQFVQGQTEGRDTLKQLAAELSTSMDLLPEVVAKINTN